MSRKIPVLEIFAPDSAKNCKKSQKFEFLQDWWQILSKTAQMTLVIFLEIIVFLTFYHLKKVHALIDSGSWDISAGQCKKLQKIAKNNTFSSFKPNCSKNRTKDFESILRIRSSHDTLSPQKICMSREILVHEIFAPDSAKNCKKSQKTILFQVSSQIFQKRNQRFWFCI